jgi:hypothetical protein
MQEDNNRNQIQRKILKKGSKLLKKWKQGGTLNAKMGP